MPEPTLAIFCPQIGSISETFVQRHVQLLCQKTVIITWRKLTSINSAWDCNSPTLILSKQPFYFLYSLSKFIKLDKYLLNRTVTKFLKKHNATIAFSEYLDYSIRWINTLEKLHIPFFVHSYGYDISENLKKDKWIQEYKKLNNPTVKAIVNEGEFVKQRLTNIGINPNKIFTITSCPIIPEFFYQRKQKDRVTFLFAGRMVGKKNPMPLLVAFNTAINTNVALHFILIGDGPLLTAAKEYVSNHKINNAVTFLGGLPNKEVLQQMQQADIFVSNHTTDKETGDEEGLPVSILEAMGQGMPVITTLHAAIPECITNNEEGFLVAPNDSVALAEKFITLGNSYSLRQTMGLKAWQRAYQQFSWEKEKDALRKLMEIEEKTTSL